MLYNYIMLALCVSIDSLGTGITYGLKNTKISNLAKVTLFFISFVITSLSLLIGNTISSLLSSFLCNLIGALILCSMGLWITFQALKKDNPEKDLPKHNVQHTNVYEFFLKSLGITIKIIRDPKYSDLDNSNNIDTREALFLAIALSLDSIGVSIGGSILGISSILFPFLVSLFQLAFLSIGSLLGNRLKNSHNIPDNVWSVIAGTLLIFIGISKFFL